MGVWLSRVMAVNGAADVLIAFNTIVMGAKLKALFPALRDNAVTPFGNRAGGW